MAWKTRPSSFGYNSAEWKALRAQVLAEEPVCRRCHRAASTEAGHVLAVSERPDLALVRSNLIGLCRSCNHHEASSKGGSRNPSSQARRARPVEAHPGVLR